MTDKIKGLLEHNEQLNKQIRSYLRDSLILLLEKKQLHDISITELCAKAGVSRMAFYSNYKSKEDLYEEIVREINKDLIAVVGSPFNQTTDLEWYEQFFEIMSENANTVNMVFSADRDRYLQAINTVALTSRPLSESQKHCRLIWLGGMVNVSMYWIQTGMKATADEMAQICYHSLASALEAYTYLGP